MLVSGQQKTGQVPNVIFCHILWIDIDDASYGHRLRQAVAMTDIYPKNQASQGNAKDQFEGSSS